MPELAATLIPVADTLLVSFDFPSAAIGGNFGGAGSGSTRPWSGNGAGLRTRQPGGRCASQLTAKPNPAALAEA